MEEQVGSHGWDARLQGGEEFQTEAVVEGAENELMFLCPSIIFAQLAEGTDLSETLVSRLRLGWSQSRSQALLPPIQSLSIGLNS